MEKAQLVDQKIPMTLNKIDEDTCYFSALYLKGKTLSKDARIKEVSVEVRAKFFSARRLVRKITIPQSINH